MAIRTERVLRIERPTLGGGGRVFDSPALFPARLVLGKDARHDEVEFRHLTRANYERSAFHDDRVETSDPNRYALPLGQILEQMPKEPQPIHYVFHTAFCGSTLLSRALEQIHPSLGLREPGLLSQVAYLGHEDTGRDWSQMLDATVALMARRWPGQQGVVVKAIDSANDVIPDLFRATPQARGILLHASIADFVAQCLKAGGSREKWLGNTAASLAPWISRRKESFPLLAPQSSSAEKAAFVWGRYMTLYGKAKSQLGPRLQLVSFDQLLHAPVETAADVHAHLWGRPPSRAALESLGSSDVLKTHSKMSDKFSATDFQRENADNRLRFRSEIGDATRWVERNLRIDPSKPV
jgi:hypothetical protein